MVQIAAALLFAIAAGLGVAVILGMLKSNGAAIISALAGEGAFPVAAGPQSGPKAKAVTLRRTGGRPEASRPVRASMPVRSPLSRAA